MEMSMLLLALAAQLAGATAEPASPPGPAPTPETSANQASSGGATGCGGAAGATVRAPTGVRGGAYLPLVHVIVPGCRARPIILPESAVLSNSAGTFVYIIDHNDAVARRDVVTGQAGDRGVVILRGLAGDERVVQAAGAFLNPGEAVRPLAARPGPEAP
jgi:hypothetical protein